MFSDRIVVCVCQQLQRSSYLSFFHSALLRCWQPFSVMPLLTKYKHSYWGLSISGMATVPSTVVRSRYLRFCCYLFYILITEVEVSQSADVGSAEGHAALPSDAASICIKPLLHIINLMSSADGCLFSLPSTSLKTARRLAPEILLSSESFNGYTGRKHGRVKVHSFICWNCFWRDCGPRSRFPLLLN